MSKTLGFDWILNSKLVVDFFEGLEQLELIFKKIITFVFLLCNLISD